MTFVWGVSFHYKSYQRILRDYKGIKAFKYANDKGNYDPIFRK